MGPTLSFITPITTHGTGFSREGMNLRAYRNLQSSIFHLPSSIFHFTGVHLWNVPLAYGLRRRGATGGAYAARPGAAQRGEAWGVDSVVEPDDHRVGRDDSGAWEVLAGAADTGGAQPRARGVGAVVAWVYHGLQMEDGRWKIGLLQ